MQTRKYLQQFQNLDSHIFFFYEYYQTIAELGLILAASEHIIITKMKGCHTLFRITSYSSLARITFDLPVIRVILLHILLV